MNSMLIKEYVAVGLLGSESNPLEPFHMQASNGNVMQADIVWLAKWSQVLVGFSQVLVGFSQAKCFEST